MAEGTRFRKLEETQETQTNHINQLRDSTTKTSTQISELTEQTNQTVLRLNEVQTTLTTLLGRLDQLTLSNNTNSSNTPPYFPPVLQPRAFKLEFPRFNGSDPSGWLFKATQFFDFHNTPQHQKLQITSFHMDGPALAWFQWMHSNYPFHDWNEFTQALEARFGDSPYTDHMGSLAKLQQTTSVADYIATYEALANRTTNLPAEFLLRNFISGLKPAIRQEVQALQPTTIFSAQGLAKLQEEKLADLHSKPTAITALALPAPKSTTLSRPSISSTPSLPPGVRRLTPEEMKTRREQGLCFNCDERFSRGHKCKQPSNLLLIEDITDIPPETEIDPITPLSTETLDISLHAFAGQDSPRTLRLQGYIKGVTIQVLVDGVGNGDTLQCFGLCLAVPVQLAGHIFHIDLFVLPLHGADIVLGAQWLRQLSPVTFDYRLLTLSFHFNSEPVTLHGYTPPMSTPITSSTVRRHLATSSIATLYHLHLNTDSTSTSPTIPHDIAPIIQLFHHLLEPPSGLPPPRNQDHRTLLLPGAKPVNVKPYRYPYFQKQEIERQVHSMLQDGLIQPSLSPFSSPVLLVRKKDGTWRFCVDFRALNAITTCDRFPIPTIDELFDELRGSKYYQSTVRTITTECDLQKTETI
ncbi:uncharacterized protein LOC133301350 [Gastrolobium bilobum]|uniref:uncharacterized protein LOC133301350 n=1 Tax=Gastrolobium bilobum TaxID=150636 RepID=UPI002AB1222C|nr:uncharacterized protein LOC133301350 [Gastrolobium bilobum]